MASTGTIITSTLQRPAVKPVSEGISLHVLSADLNTNEPITTFEQNNGHDNRSHKNQRYLRYYQKRFQAPFHSGINPVNSSHRKKGGKDVQQHSDPAAERHLKALHLERAVDRFILHCGQMQEASWFHSICRLMANISMLEGCLLACRTVQTIRRCFEGRWCIGEGPGGWGSVVPLYCAKPNGKPMDQAPGFHVLEQMLEHWPKSLPSGLGGLDYAEELRCLKFGGFNKDSSRVQWSLFMFMNLWISPWHDISSQC